MNDASILGQVAMCYSAFIDRNRAVSARRLTVFPMRPDAPPDVHQRLATLTEVWPPDGGRTYQTAVGASSIASRTVPG